MTRARDLGDFIADGAAAELVVDTTTLVVDSTNNRVGIGTASPSQALDVSGTVISTGLASTTAGTSNFRAGVNAGNSITSGGNYNTVVGDEAGTALTTGDNNTAIGFEALSTEDADGNNTAIGYQALKTLNAGASGFNTAVGVASGTAMTTGVKNTLLGHGSGAALTDADFNIAIGFGALNSDTLGSKSVAIGEQTLNAQNFTTATDSHNTAVGFQAGAAVTTGYSNTLIGGLVGDALTDGVENVALGYNSLGADTRGSKSVAIGKEALKVQNFTTSVSSYNVAVGFKAGEANQTGVRCTFVGAEAGDVSTVSDNTFIGQGAGGLITTGDANTILGRFSGNENGLDIRTSSNNIVLSDGDGNPRVAIGSAGQLGIGGATYGTSGQVLTSGGSGAAPSWADAGGGAYEVVSSSNYSSSSITINVTTDTMYIIEFEKFLVGTNGASINLGYSDSASGNTFSNRVWKGTAERDLNSTAFANYYQGEATAQVSFTYSNAPGTSYPPGAVGGVFGRLYYYQESGKKAKAFSEYVLPNSSTELKEGYYKALVSSPNSNNSPTNIARLRFSNNGNATMTAHIRVIKGA